MNHNVTLAIVAIVAATTLTAVAFAIPQQALAGGHHNHKHNSIKVDQQINQLNECSGSPPEPRTVSLGTVCLNQAENNADIDK